MKINTDNRICRTSAVPRKTANAVSLTYLSKLRYRKIPSSSRLQSRVVDEEQTLPNEDVMAISRRIMQQNKKAYEVLAK